MAEMTESDLIAETADYAVRVLPPDEWERHRVDLPPSLPNPEFAFLIVVEEKSSGRIVASQIAMTVTMLEGLHIIESERGKQTAIHGLLWGGMLSMLASLDIRHPLTIAQNAGILALARKAGFREVPGTLLLLE